jgi:polyhydroxyalkanoic acid synthase PhaR subunit
MSDASPPPEDPLRPMREAYEQVVEGWSKAMEQMVASEEFASASGEFLKRYVAMQESLRTASRAAAESVHFPTTDDLARLAQLVINVERKVDEISDEAHAVAERLAAVEARLAELARPKPPARRRAKPAAKG